MKYIPLAARICLALIFIRGGIGNFLGFTETQQRMAEMGLPIPSLLLLGNIVFQLVGAISLILGFKVRWGAALLIVFLIPTTLVFHPFWTNADETIAFLKNLGLIGGLLLMYYVGAGAVSVDEQMKT